MERTNFENLRVYQLAEQVADEIWDAVQGWNNFAMDTVGKQIVRSADSIGANIAEGSGRGSFQDNRRFVRIAGVSERNSAFPSTGVQTQASQCRPD